MSKTESADGETEDDGQEYANMRVPIEAWETAKEAKEEAGETWAEYMLRCADQPGKNERGVTEEDVNRIIEDRVVDQALR